MCCIRGCEVGNNLHLSNTISVDNTGGTIITVLPTIVLSSNIYHVRGIPGVRSISAALRVLRRLNTRIHQVSHRAIRVSPAAVHYRSISRRLTKDVHTSCCFLNSLLNGCNCTYIPVPNNYRFNNNHPCSLRLGNFATLNTSILDPSGSTPRSTDNYSQVRLGNRQLVNGSVCLSAIDINTAIGVVLTTIQSVNLAIVRGTTGRPRVISLTGFLGAVKTSIHNTNASIVGVHNIRRLDNTACSVVPSRVRTNACVTVTMTARNSILIHGIVPGRLRSVATGLRRVKTLVRRVSSTIHIQYDRPLQTYGIGAVPRPNFPGSVRPRDKILLSLTRKADRVSRNV